VPGHDELVFELPEAELERASAFVRDSMQNVMELRVPLVVDLAHGRNWAEAHA
jgi:DNA polymerase-1